MDGNGFGWILRPALIGGAIGVGGFLLFALSTTPAPALPSVLPMDAPAPPKPDARETPPMRVISPVETYQPTRAPTHPYGNCAEARAAGHAPVYAGEPGYGAWLDGDDDGIGCEPYHGR